MSCPFCDIDQEKTRILEKGENFFVVFSNPRLMPGHILIVPNRHIEKISELNKEEKTEMLELIVKWQEKILEKISAGCDIRQNFRPFQKDSRLKLGHFHVHLQPRDFKDELYEKCQIYETEMFHDLNEKELDKMMKLFL